MLDPEQLTMAQWFWICFVLIVVIFMACRCIDLNAPVGPITYLNFAHPYLSPTALGSGVTLWVPSKLA